MLRQLFRALALCGCAIAAGCGVSATGTGVTPGFAEAARDAHSYMKSDLIPAIGTARFPDAYAVSRTKVRLVQSKVAGNADQGVWLLLTMVNVKSNEAHGARELAETMRMDSRVVREAALDVANERDTCLSEADSWLTGTSLQLPVLNAGPCLQQARLALSVLTQKK
jgi:hypothetical protein